MNEQTPGEPDGLNECNYSDCTNEPRGLDKAPNRIAAAFCSDEHEIQDELAFRDDEYDIRDSQDLEDGKVISIPIPDDIHQRMMEMHAQTGYLLTDLYGMTLRQGIDDIESWLERLAEDPRMNRVAGNPIIMDPGRDNQDTDVEGR